MRSILLIIVGLLSSCAFAQSKPSTFKNPIVTGFHSDPSICRVGDTYYMTHPTLVEMTQQESGITPIYNPGKGLLQLEQERPDLPWTPVPEPEERNDFDSDKLGLEWIFIRSPIDKWHQLKNETLTLELRPQLIDSLVNPSFIAQRITSHRFEISTQLLFNTNKDNEQTGLVVYRKSSTHYQLVKQKGQIAMIKTVALNEKGTASTKEIFASIPYNPKDVCLKVSGNGLDLKFYYGESPENLKPIGPYQDFSIVSDEVAGRFNGTVVGLYATSKGKQSKNTASFEWFENKNIE